MPSSRIVGRAASTLHQLFSPQSIRTRLARRRIARTAPPPPAVLTDRRGLRFELVSTEEIEAFLLNEGHFEGEELDFLAATDRSGVSIDVGANIGVFTALLARGGGHVHAFEPMESTRARLRRTLDLNGLTNVTVHAGAVSDATGSAQLASYGPGYESWTSLTREAINLPDGVMRPVEHVSVDTLTLDAFCEREGIDQITVLKVDVEGAEGRVLAGARRLLSEQRVGLLMMELSDHTLGDDGRTAHELLDLLAADGYTVWQVRRGQLAPFRPDGPVDFANIVATVSA